MGTDHRKQRDRLAFRSEGVITQVAVSRARFYQVSDGPFKERCVCLVQRGLDTYQSKYG